MDCSTAFLAECVVTDTVVDLVFVVDGSGSICDNDPTRRSDGSGCNNWQQMVDFVTDFISVMEPSEDGTHVGLVTFSTESNVLTTLNRFVHFIN